MLQGTDAVTVAELAQESSKYQQTDILASPQLSCQHASRWCWDKETDALMHANCLFLILFIYNPKKSNCYFLQPQLDQAAFCPNSFTSIPNSS